MKSIGIYYWNLHENFGDLINPWLWPKVFPHISFYKCPKIKDGIVNVPEEILLVGIGTLLNDKFPIARRAVVMGAGVGYGALETMSSNIDIYCVRGPLSAEKLGLSESYGIIDPGVLVKKYYDPKISKKYSFSFMPQISSIIACQGEWEEICAEIGFGYIDPRLPVEGAIDKILSTEILLTESMHGAIVSDAYRIPWLPIVSRNEILSFKWKDWCMSVDLEYKPVQIPHVDYYDNKLKNIFKKSVFKKKAARSLLDAAKNKPILSNDEILIRKIDMLYGAIDKFMKDEKLRNA
jgi:succinoglycan biosynthesis protein ExoV